MKLQQAFYGNDGAGYRLLGISDPAYSDIAESLCGKIGTPDATEFTPILFSKPIRDMLFMGYCQRGPKDQAGRLTLFFHLLFGHAEACSAAGINAWGLLQKEFFKAQPISTIHEIIIDCDMGDEVMQEPPFTWDGTALAIRSNHPENELVCSLAGKQINAVAWSGFCYRMSSDFTLFGLSSSVETPEFITCCTPSGEKYKSSSEKDSFSSWPSSSSSTVLDDKRLHKRSLLPLFFFFSMVLNIILIFLFTGKFGKAPDKKPAENTAQLQQLSKENERLQNICRKIQSFNFSRRLEDTQDIKNFLNDPQAKKIKAKDYQFVYDLQELFQNLSAKQGVKE